MISKLTRENSLGYTGAKNVDLVDKSKSTSATHRVVDLACGWKMSHPESVLLVRMGDFYEAWGIDAVMLVQYAGLNPMGDSCRAGCPKSNIQQTLNSLTDAGLSVAVYEEANIVGSRSRKIKKERYLSQIVTPGRPIYLHDTCLKEGELPYRSARPYAAIQCSSGDNGCSLALFSVDSRQLRVYESTTIEAIGSILEGVGGVASPTWISAESQSRLSRLNLTSTRQYPITLSFVSFLAAVSSDLKRMLALDQPFIRSVDSEPTKSLQPLHFVAAQFLGVTKNSHNASPDLVKNLLPQNAPFHCEFFLRNWLLCPPASAGSHMHALLNTITKLKEPVPSARVVPVDKLIRLLETRNGNYHFFLDLYQSCETFLNTPKALTTHCRSLLTIVNKVSGLKARTAEDLEQIAKKIQKRINGVIVTDNSCRPSNITSPICESLDRFIRGKENDLFNQIRGDYAVMDLARNRLVEAVTRSVIWPDKSLKYDAISDKLYVKDIDVSIRQTGDAKKKLIPDDTTRKRYSTDLILKAEADYRDAVELARDSARHNLHALCDSVSEDIDSKEGLIIFSHWAVVLSSAVLHVSHAQRRGWVLPKIGGGSSKLNGLWPYWLDPNPVGLGVGNDATIKSGKISVLTAPNMSGKSTLIRAVGAAVLLGNSGLMIPAKSNSTVSDFEKILVVSPNGDKPVEGMSAFGAEAEAMSVSLREVRSSGHVLLLVDEFGRGTSGKDASSLSGAVLEFLGKRENIACIWATHLHELFDMKDLRGVVDWLQMDGFKLLPGKCTDSKGIETARHLGFPEDIILKALKLRDKERFEGNVESGTDDTSCPVKRIHSRLFTSNDGLMEIPRGHSPPPSLLSSPLVYILRFADQFYIGETENYSQRMKAHKSRFEGAPDQVWIVKQSDRSRARAVESALIRAYLDEGLQLLSTVDGFHNHSVAAN